MKRLTLLLNAALFALAMSSGARAQDMARATALAGHLARGEIERGEAEFARLSPDAQTIAALGVLRFARAIEKLGRNFHRHGLQPPTGMPMLPVLRLPVPPNPSPEPLTYEKLRAVYVDFLADLAAVETTLKSMPAGAVKLPLDLAAIRLDLNGDGVASDAESLGAIARAMMTGRPACGQSEPFVVAFDRGDALWLRGYARLVSAFLEFTLAHDWRETFDAAGHLFFAGARPAAALGAPANLMFGRDDRIADVIALVHLIHWPVAEPARLLATRDHVKAVIALSRESWKEILAETDDDREWIPSPRQKNSAFPGMRVTQERVDGWLHALDAFEEVLDGKRLVPHWRFSRGIDFSAIFTSPRPFDLVLWITGHAALPYLKDGPTMSREDWARWERVFGGEFMLFAAWFN